MSVVTDVVLLSPIQDEGVLENLNLALLTLDVGELTNIGSHAGGRKNLQATVWAGAFNYLELDELLNILRRFDWKYSKPRLFIQEEDNRGFEEQVI